MRTHRPDIYASLDHDAVEGRFAAAAGRAVVIALFVGLCAWVQGLHGAPRYAWAFIFFVFPFPFIGWLVFAQAVKMVGDMACGLVAYRERKRHAAVARRDSAADEVGPVMTGPELRAEMARMEMKRYLDALPPWPRERHGEAAATKAKREREAAATKKVEDERRSTTAVVAKREEPEATEFYYPPDTKDPAHRAFVKQATAMWDLDSAMGDERDRINKLRQEGKL